MYKPIKTSGTFSDNFVEYKSGSRNDKSISIACYLSKIREHFRKMIDDKKNWKVEDSISIKKIFFSSKNFHETRDMYSKSDNVEIMKRFDTNEIIKKLLILL